MQPEQLPIARLAVLAGLGRPVFYPLECAWDIYDYDTVMLLDGVRSMWDDPPYQRSLRALVNDIAVGKYFVTVDAQQRIAPIRERARAGNLEFGDLVAVTGEVLCGQASMATIASLRVHWKANCRRWSECSLAPNHSRLGLRSSMERTDSQKAYYSVIYFLGTRHGLKSDKALLLTGQTLCMLKNNFIGG
jgi:hypothetical protein